MVPATAPYFHDAFEAVRRVEILLENTTNILSKSKIPFAIVGANAVAAWVASVDPDATRSTKDVDILVNRTDLGRINHSLRDIGLIEVDVLGVPLFVERDSPACKRGVRLLFADELVRPGYRYPSPAVDHAVTSYFGWPVVRLSALLVMKLQANRTIDKVHVRDMLGVDLITDAVRRELPKELLARLTEIEAIQEDTH